MLSRRSAAADLWAAVDDQPLVKDGIVEAVRCYGSNLISKEPLAERLASPEGQLIPARSALHEELLEGFWAEEQNSGMEWGSMPLLM